MIDKLIEKYGTILNTLRENKKIADSTDFYPYNVDIKNTREYLKDLKALKKQLAIPVVSTRTFENECELYVDTETDEWVLKHKGVIKKRAKSKFECLLTKQELKKRLGV